MCRVGGELPRLLGWGVGVVAHGGRELRGLRGAARSGVRALPSGVCKAATDAFSTLDCIFNLRSLLYSQGLKIGQSATEAARSAAV